MVMAGVGAWFLLSRRDEALGRVSVRVGVIVGLVFSIASLFPTGAKQGENIVAYPADQDGGDGGALRDARGGAAGHHRHAGHRQRAC